LFYICLFVTIIGNTPNLTKHDLNNLYLDKNHRLQQLLHALDEPVKRIDYNVQDIIDRLDSQYYGRLLISCLLMIKDLLIDDERCKVLTWLSTVKHIENFKFSIDGLIPGTGIWLLATDKYRNWRNSSSSTLLWLRGDRKY